MTAKFSADLTGLASALETLATAIGQFRPLRPRGGSCAYCGNAVRETVDHRCYGCGAPWPAGAHDWEHVAILRAGVVSRNEARGMLDVTTGRDRAPVYIQEIEEGD